MNEIRSQGAADTATASKIGVGDGDIHPAKKGPKDFHPWLSKRWQDHIDEYGAPARQGWLVGPAYPKSQPNASRRDSNPPEGGRPGSSLAFMQLHHGMGSKRAQGCNQHRQGFELLHEKSWLHGRYWRIRHGRGSNARRATNPGSGSPPNCAPRPDRPWPPAGHAAGKAAFSVSGTGPSPLRRACAGWPT